MENLNVTQLTKKLEEVSQDINLATTNEEINRIIEDLVTKSLDAEFSSIWFYDRENFILTRARETNHRKDLLLNHKKGIIYKCFMTKESSLYNYLASDKDYVASIDNPDNIKIKSKVMLPLLEENGNLIGIVTAYNSIRKNKKFSKNDVEILKALSPYIINAIYKMHNPKKVKEPEVKVVEEIKRVKNSQEVVEKSDETLTFVANFVHDIRTPANTL
ncbi:MAG: GAF domain-containing protein, partial [Epsilonproteobacteria bacterium]|nr:GAF domain-containing protein [Campylobacterota bacterium]